VLLLIEGWMLEDGRRKMEEGRWKKEDNLDQR
jgi:hypothetical protein